jgi:hypothetical protein
MENFKNKPQQSRQRRQSVKSNNRQCTQGQNSTTTQSQPISPIPNIRPTNSSSNISSHPSKVVSSIPTFVTSSNSQNVIISHDLTKEANKDDSIPKKGPISSSSQSPVGTKRKTPDSNIPIDTHYKYTNMRFGRLNNSIHTQPSEINDTNETPMRQRHYQTRGVNLYNKFTAAITPNDPSTSIPQQVSTTRSQYSHIFDNHTIDSSSSESDAGSTSSLDSEEDSENDSELDEEEEDEEDAEEDQG